MSAPPDLPTLIRDAEQMAYFIEQIRDELDTPYLSPTWIAEQIETLRRKSPPNKKAIMTFQQCHNSAQGLQKAAKIRLPRADIYMDRVFEAFQDLSNHPEITATETSAMHSEIERYILTCTMYLAGFKGAPKVITDTLTEWIELFAKEKKNLQLWAAEVERLADATATFQQPGPEIVIWDPSDEQVDLYAPTGKCKGKKKQKHTKCKRRYSLCPHDARID